MSRKTRTLFLCRGNSCRSQMAEGLARHLRKADIEAQSAGAAPSFLDPLAVRAMGEIGIDISNYKSKGIDQLDKLDFDLVVTLCDKEDCPAFKGAPHIIHLAFDDPPRLTAKMRNPDEKIMIYRRVRDEIREFILTLQDKGKK